MKQSASRVVVSGDCSQLRDAATKISEAQTALYSGRGSRALTTLTNELRGLHDGAPPDVKAALTDLVTGFDSANSLLQHPTDQNKARLAKLASRLATAGQQVTAYVTSKCH